VKGLPRIAIALVTLLGGRITVTHCSIGFFGSTHIRVIDNYLRAIFSGFGI
jgi:hypothetical protein